MFLMVRSAIELLCGCSIELYTNSHPKYLHKANGFVRISLTTTSLQNINLAIKLFLLFECSRGKTQTSTRLKLHSCSYCQARVVRHNEEITVRWTLYWEEWNAHD